MRRRHYDRYDYDEYNDYEPRELARDPIHARLGGVCAGIARYLGVSRFAVRLVAVIALVVASKVTLIAYGLAWLILDERVG